MYRIVRASNFDKDWFDEEFVENIPLMTDVSAKEVADLLNRWSGPNSEYCWKVVYVDYKLYKGIHP